MSTRVRKIDINGEWTFGKGPSNYVKDQDAMEQKINTRLKSFLGDCFFDITHGVDWWTILGSVGSLLNVSVAVRTQIIDTEGVTKLIELNSDRDENRNVSLSYSLSTIYSVSEPLESSVEVI